MTKEHLSMNFTNKFPYENIYKSMNDIQYMNCMSGCYYGKTDTMFTITGNEQ